MEGKEAGLVTRGAAPYEVEKPLPNHLREEAEEDSVHQPLCRTSNALRGGGGGGGRVGMTI